MTPLASFLPADVDPVARAEACGDQPGNVCRFVFDRTESETLAKAADWLTGTPLEVLFVLVGAWVLNRLLRRAIKRFAAQIEGSRESGRIRRWRERAPAVLLSTGEVNLRSAARAQTIAVVLRSICTAIIWTFAVIYVLDALGLQLGPLLAGAGVAGVALGFGAQSLVKDFLSGIFLLIEDQFGVGDVVDVGEATGSVEMVTLRVTRLRDVNGTVWYVPNGEIRRVGNMSQQWAMTVVDVAVSPDSDLTRATDIIGETAEAVWEDDTAKPDVLGRPEVLGIDYFGPDAAVIRLQGRTRAGAQWRVGRLLRVRIAQALTDAGVELPPSTFVRPGVFKP